jgi:class 3 adenylate cyclase
MESQNQQVAVLFTDIRSFTSISKGRSPEDLFQDLNRYLQIMADVIYRRNGIIDKYIGDSIMAYFGYPLYGDNTALQAVLAAIEMIDATSNAKSTEGDLSVYHTAIGMCLGPVIIGNIGHPERKLNFTIIGDTVNLASRMESLTSVYEQEILISESMYDKVKNALPCRMVDTLPVQGRDTSVRAYTTKKELSQEEQAAWKKHNQGMDFYQANDFAAAVQCFHDVLQHLENDYLAKMMIERCTKKIQ